MAQTNPKNVVTPNEEPSQLSVPDQVIRESGQELSFGDLLQRIAAVVGHIQGVGDVREKEAAEAVAVHIKEIQVLVNEATVVRTNVLAYSNERTAATRAHLDLTINGLKKTRLQLRALLLG